MSVSPRNPHNHLWPQLIPFARVAAFVEAPIRVEESKLKIFHQERRHQSVITIISEYLHMEMAIISNSILANLLVIYKACHSNCRAYGEVPLLNSVEPCSLPFASS